MIPRTFHQIWLGQNPMPKEYAGYQQTWTRKHPDWELRLWTEEDIPGDLRRPEAAEKLRAPAERADILRLELLWRYGGVYVDTDFECRQSIEPLLGEHDFVIGLAKPGRVNNALIGAAAGHPILDRALEELQPREYHGYDKSAAGPMFLDGLLLRFPEQVVYLDPDLLYPRTPAAAEHAFAIHHEARSWKSHADLVTDAVRAAQRLAQTEDELAVAEKRYRLAREELEAVRRSDQSAALAARTKRLFVRRMPRERIRYALGTLRARVTRRAGG